MDLDAEGLLKIVLLLVIVWIALEVVDVILDVLLGPFRSILGLLIVVLIVLFLLDRL